MLEKYIFFVSKQPLLVALDDLHQVYFSRVGASMGANAARTFDLRLVQQNGPEYTFTSIQKEEKDAVENYLKDKKIKIKNEMVPDAQLITQADLDDDDDDMDSRSENSDKPAKKANFDDDDSETDGASFCISLCLQICLQLRRVFPGFFDRRRLAHRE